VTTGSGRPLNRSRTGRLKPLLWWSRRAVGRVGSADAHRSEERDASRGAARLGRRQRVVEGWQRAVGRVGLADAHQSEERDASGGTARLGGRRRVVEGRRPCGARGLISICAVARSGTQLQE
jgi:hypothetical protein